MAGRGGPKPTRKPRRDKDDKAWQKRGKRKYCQFCKDKVDRVDFKDVIMLRKFVSDRGKIRARRVTGNCVQHQRDVASAVKNGRPARRPGRCRRCRRWLRTQLSDPSGSRREGGEGHAAPRRESEAGT
jgi:small subunit ribosomal protein S18